MSSRLAWCALVLCACRVETVAPGGSGGTASCDTPSGEVWVYTSMYRHVLDALDPVITKALPNVKVHWFQAGSEKVASRLEAELTAGGTACDLLLTSDPFLYERYKKEGRWLRYMSPNAVRVPRQLIDPDGAFTAVRLSTMVLVHHTGVAAPESFEALANPALHGEVALGDPLTSGTAFTWAVALEAKFGADYFAKLRENQARVAGGNAAVLQKIEGREASVGVLLLENALTAKAKGSPIEIAWPSDGAVLIPGYAGILATTRNASAAKAVEDVLLSPEGQDVIARLGDMHAVDPRVAGPRGSPSLDDVLTRAQKWDEPFLARGLSDGDRVKQAFTRAFAQ